MLVLNRRVGELISIGDDIKILVKDYKGGRVKIGIDAPRDMEVNREESKKARSLTMHRKE